MNLTSIAGTTNKNWKRAKAHYVALAAGMALAVGAALALPSASTPSSSVSAVTRATAHVMTGDPDPHHFFYIVGSEAEATALEAADFALISPEGARLRDPNVYFHVLVAGSRSTLALLGVSVLEMDHVGTRYTIIDTTEADSSRRITWRE
jgi:hypothetical protein